jgi:hypothetical protein
MLPDCGCGCLVDRTYMVILERADVWLFARDKSHEIKSINNYYCNFYFLQIQF